MGPNVQPCTYASDRTFLALSSAWYAGFAMAPAVAWHGAYVGRKGDHTSGQPWAIGMLSSRDRVICKDGGGSNEVVVIMKNSPMKTLVSRHITHLSKMLRSISRLSYSTVASAIKKPHDVSLNLPVNLPQMRSSSLADADSESHVASINRNLSDSGILKVTLEFDDDNSQYLTRLIQRLHTSHDHGLPLTHSAHRGWFWDIRPSSTTFQCPNHQARSETMNEFPWHTDCSYEEHPPRFFALQVLQPDRCGGGTLSVLKVEQLLKLLSSTTRAALSQPEYRIIVPPEFRKTNNPEESIIGNLIAPEPSGSLALRFREDIFTPLTRSAGLALDELKAVLLSPQAQAQVLQLTPQLMPRGSIVLMDNRRWLHGRNHVKDPMRHLRRVRWGGKPFGL